MTTTTTTKARPLSFVRIHRDDRGNIVTGQYFEVPDEPYLQGYLTGMKAVRELVQWIKTTTDTRGFKYFVISEVLNHVGAIRGHATQDHGTPNKLGAAAAMSSYVVELMLEGVESFNMGHLNDRITQHDQHAKNAIAATTQEGGAA